MKKTLILFLFFASFICFAQTSNNLPLLTDNSGLSSSTPGTDSINIMSLVKAQVKDAMERELKGEIKSSIYNAYAGEELLKVAPVSIVKEDSVITEILYDILNNRILLLGVISVFIISTVFIRRKLHRPLQKLSREPRENLTTLQPEKNSLMNNPELELIRRKLMNTLDYEFAGKSISAKAKELNIAKGEIILATKLKSFQLAELSKK